MNIRRSIDLIESAAEESIALKIAQDVAAGVCEGFKPYWKLIADPRVLEDTNALAHIATLIMDGYTSGIHPTWELKLVDEVEEVTVDEEVLLPPGTPQVSGAVEEEELDEEVLDIVHAYGVVPVAEIHGQGKGWYEVSKSEATRFVVEDEKGNAVEYHDTWEEARAAARRLNDHTRPSDMEHYRAPVEEDGVEGHDHEDYHVGDDALEDETTRFDKKEDYIVIINAIHERGVRQQEALKELSKRGLWLSDEQKKQAGLI